MAGDDYAGDRTRMRREGGGKDLEKEKKRVEASERTTRPVPLVITPVLIDKRHLTQRRGYVKRFAVNASVMCCQRMALHKKEKQKSPGHDSDNEMVHSEHCPCAPKTE